MAEEKKKNYTKLIIVALIILTITLVFKFTGIAQYVSIDNLNKLSDWIESYGLLGPVVYILFFIVSTAFFLPGLPVAVLGGIVFGAVWGTIYASIGSTLGATAAFLIARYAARDTVESWVKGNKQFEKIDSGVREHGWRMLMITRLVPIFPFNLQNYAYGLTDIPLKTYILVSYICMLPGAIAFTFAGGSIRSGQGDIGKTFIYLGIAGVFFVLLSLIPKWLKKRSSIDIESMED